MFNAAHNITQWRSSARAPVFLGRIGTYFTDFTDVALPPSVPIKKAHQAACVFKSLYPPFLFAITPRRTPNDAQTAECRRSYGLCLQTHSICLDIMILLIPVIDGVWDTHTRQCGNLPVCDDLDATRVADRNIDARRSGPGADRCGVMGSGRRNRRPPARLAAGCSRRPPHRPGQFESQPLALVPRP